MEELFSTIIYLVPISIFVALRILGARKKAQEAKDSPKRAPDFPGGLSARTQAAYREDERVPRINRAPEVELEEWKPHWVEEGSPEAEESLPGKPASPAPAGAVGVHARTEEVKTLVGSLSGESFAFSPAAPAPYAEAPPPQSAETLVKAGGAAGPFPASIERLPILQRAFVFSEILGKPKSLRNQEE